MLENDEQGDDDPDQLIPTKVAMRKVQSEVPALAAAVTSLLLDAGSDDDELQPCNPLGDLGGGNSARERRQKGRQAWAPKVRKSKPKESEQERISRLKRTSF